MAKKFNTIQNPFGTGIDEQATTDAFEDYVGGRERATRLFNIWKNTYSYIGNRFDPKPKTRKDVFRDTAKKIGFTEEDRCVPDTFIAREQIFAKVKNMKNEEIYRQLVAVGNEFIELKTGFLVKVKEIIFNSKSNKSQIFIRYEDETESIVDGENFDHTTYAKVRAF